MADLFPKSVVLHFPPNVYQKIGAQEMFPHLLKIFKAEDLSCIQFVRGGKVRVSFCERSVRDYHLSEGVCFQGQVIPVIKDADKVAVVCLQNLPYEVADEDISDFFKTYGEVLAVGRSVSAGFPSLYNGNSVMKLILKESLPYFLSVCGCNCRVWYRDQPVQCFVCHEVGHQAQSCALSGRCRRCHQPGHMARDCTWAWDPVPPAVAKDPAPVDFDPVDADPSDPVLPPIDSAPVPPDVSVVADVPAPVDAHPPSVPVNASLASAEGSVASESSESSTLHKRRTVLKSVSDPPALAEGSAVSKSSGASTTSRPRPMLGLSLPSAKDHVSNVTYRKSHNAIREQFSSLRRSSFVRMNSSDLKQFVLDALWAKNISCDKSPVFETLLAQLMELRKCLRDNPTWL